MSRLKEMESKRRSDSKASAKSKESTRDKTSPKSTNLIPQSFSAQVTSKFPRISKLSKTKAEQIAALRRKLSFPQVKFWSNFAKIYNCEIVDSSEGLNSARFSLANHEYSQDGIHGFSKHVTRHRDKLNATPVNIMEAPRKKSKSRNSKVKNNIKIINQSAEIKKSKIDDYLLKKRIERENYPEKSFKRRHWWNMSLRENCTDEDYFKMHYKAQEVARKALLKEQRVLESFSEKEKMEHNIEIDKMLIDSLKAKIQLINNL